MPTANDNAPAGAPSRTDKILATALAVRPAVKQILEAMEQIEALNGRSPSPESPEPSEAQDVPSPPDPALLVSAVKLLRTAIGNGEQPDDDELHNLHEAVTFAMFRLVDWLDAAGNLPMDLEPDPSPIFDALDGVTFVREAILKGVNPTGSKTISPVKGTLRLCIERIETALDEHTDSVAAAEKRYPGRVEIDRTGAGIALEMLRYIDSEQPEYTDGVTVADYCQLENWPRRGRPFRNLVAEYLEKARVAGPEAMEGFCAILSGYISENAQGAVPDIGIFEQWYGPAS